MKRMVFCIIPLLVVIGCAGGAKPATQQESPAAVAQTSNDSPGSGNNVNEIGAATQFDGPVVTTLAGNGKWGYADGPAQAAQFAGPRGVAVDNAGNIYVADRSNHRIRKITPGGVVTTFAGSTATDPNSDDYVVADEGGYADGTGTAAKFFWPTGLAVDSTGNVYVADIGNHRIRKISPEGVVTTLAGSGEQGYADGTGAKARFNQPAGVAVDSAGNVYVADNKNHRIRKISPEGAVTTLAGSTQGYADGTGAVAKFNVPIGVAVDSAGNVYVAENDNHRIRKISPEGAVTTLAGSGKRGYADGTATEAQFNEPSGVAVDGAGNLYVAEFSNNRIRKISPAGEVSTLAGSTPGYADGPAQEAQFTNPNGVAVDGAGDLYVADRSNGRIRMITIPAP